MMIGTLIQAGLRAGCASGGGTLLALRALMLIRLARLLRLLALSPRFRHVPLPPNSRMSRVTAILTRCMLRGGLRPVVTTVHIHSWTYRYV